MNNQGPIPQPDLRSILNQERDTTSSGINAIRVGTIVSFNPGKQSVVVRLVNPSIVYNAAGGPTSIPPDPVAYTIPDLVQVPVFVLCGGTAFLGMPIAAGDTCIVLFNDRDLDPWWSNGTTGAPPNSDRMHSLADGIALVGIRPATKPILGLPGDGQHVTFGNNQTTMLAILNALIATASATIAACSALDSVKTGGSAAAAIAAAQTQLNAAALLPPEMFQ